MIKSVQENATEDIILKDLISRNSDVFNVLSTLWNYDLIIRSVTDDWCENIELLTFNSVGVFKELFHFSRIQSDIK